MNQLTDLDQKTIDWLTEKAQTGEISQAGFVQIFELCATFGHIYTKTQAAKISGTSYNGIKHRCRAVNFPGAKLVAICKPPRNQ